MKTLLLASLLLLAPAFAQAEEAKTPAPNPPNPETVDISDLEQDYWRPNKDELEVVQNRRFEKAGRFELAAQYGIYQGEDFKNSRAVGVAASYNISNRWFVEGSYLNISSSDNDFVGSLRQRFNFRPDFNYERSQALLQVGWVPIYAKFSLLGEKISHFELYLAAGGGVTKTVANRFTGAFTVGNKFFITDHLLFRLEWRMTRYTDRIETTQGSTSIDKGGPGYFEQGERKNNIVFGLGWMF
jgi:outer membrane beta-barrel protein